MFPVLMGVQAKIQTFIVQHTASTVRQSLDYLIFDYSEDEDGNGTWDAMASAAPARLPALIAEVQAVLSWAAGTFPGRCGDLEDGNDWNFDLSAQDDSGAPLKADFDVRSKQLHIQEASDGGHTTITLTLTGNAPFAQALLDAFDLEGDLNAH